MTRRIRVLELCTGLLVEGDSGGITQFVVELSRAFAGSSIEPVIGALWDYGTAFEAERATYLRHAGLEVWPAALWRKPQGAWNVVHAFQCLRAELIKSPVDVIHCHTEFGSPLAIALKQVSLTPIVMRTLHSHEWQRRPYLRPLARLIYPLAFDCEIGIGPQVQASLNTRWLAQRLGRRALFLNNAIPLRRFENVEVDVAALRASLGLPPEALVIGSVGRLAEEKGFDVLLRALPPILAVLPNVYCVLIGMGRCENELRALAHTLGIAERVLFTGPRTDVPALLRCFNLFVSASRWEGLSTVIMEAMASGVPVLATDIIGTRPLIQHHHTGWLVPPEDVTALAHGVVQALQQTEQSQRHAARAREAVRAFSIETVAAQHVELYQTLMQKR